jgi:hypothetical protein
VLLLETQTSGATVWPTTNVPFPNPGGGAVVVIAARVVAESVVVGVVAGGEVGRGEVDEMVPPAFTSLVLLPPLATAATRIISAATALAT